MKSFFFKAAIVLFFVSCSKNDDLGLGMDGNGGKRNNSASNKVAGILIDPNGQPGNKTVSVSIGHNGKNENVVSKRTEGTGLDPNGIR